MADKVLGIGYAVLSKNGVPGQTGRNFPCAGESGETFTEIGQGAKSWPRGPGDETSDELSLRSIMACKQ